MDDPSALHDLMRRHQEGMAGATALSLLFGMNYAILKRVPLGRAVVGSLTGALVAGTLWLFLGEYMHLPLYWIVPVGAGSGYFSYPLLSAWVQKDEEFADGVVGETKGFLGRFFRRGPKP